MASLADVSDTLRAIENIIDVIRCPSCFLYFNKRWCKNKETSCFFCTNFVPNHDTYNSVINDIDWYFINSDEYDHKLFCREFKQYLYEWMNEFPKPRNYISSWLYL